VQCVLRWFSQILSTDNPKPALERKKATLIK
jgi:hypothetical protein